MGGRQGAGVGTIRAVKLSGTGGGGRRCLDRAWGTHAAVQEAGDPVLPRRSLSSRAPLEPRPTSSWELRMRASTRAGQVAGGSECATTGGVGARRSLPCHFYPTSPPIPGEWRMWERLRINHVPGGLQEPGEASNPYLRRVRG